MDVISKYKVVIDCKAKIFCFKPPEEEMFVFVGDRCSSQKMFISAMKARKLLASGCTSYLVSVIDTTKKEKDELNDVPIVNEFTSVFPEDLPSVTRSDIQD